MAENRQYPRKADINTTTRLKYVSTFVMRGWSASRIARELEYDLRTAQRDIIAVKNRTTEIADLDAHLSDVQSRTKEQLQQLGENKAIIWKAMEWASAWVPQLDQFGQPIHARDENGEVTSGYEFGPRKPHLIGMYSNQLSALQEKEQKLLGLLDKTVDVTVRLEQNVRIQNVLLEVIQQINDPRLYEDVRRRIAAVKASLENSPQAALPASSSDIIEGEFIDVG